jgi:hypothetical protein
MVQTFKRWRELATLWLTAMNVMYVTTGKAPEGVSEEKFNADDNLFRGAIISVLVDNLVDTYLHRKTGKDVWEALVVWTSLGPLPRWVPGPTTRWPLGLLD